MAIARRLETPPDSGVVGPDLMPPALGLEGDTTTGWPTRYGAESIVAKWAAAAFRPSVLSAAIGAR